MTNTFSIGQSVTARFAGAGTHLPPVNGTVSAVREGARGIWYDVTFTNDAGKQDERSFRAGQLVAA